MLLEVRFGGNISAAPEAAEHAAGHVVTPLVKVSAVLKSTFAKGEVVISQYAGLGMLKLKLELNFVLLCTYYLS